jgi:hypothetical protein
MMTTLRSFIGWLRKRAESGYTVAIQAIYYTVLLFIFFALIYDFGNVGYIATVATNATRLAAQDAAKNIDRDAFVYSQQVILNPDAPARAQELVDDATGGKVKITRSPEIKHIDSRGVDVIVVYASATAEMPVLGSLFGIGSITFPVQAFAEPAYGIDQEGQ